VDRVYFQPTNLDVYTYRRQGFWRRQFDDATTPAQLQFDIAFGLVLPALCFLFDPVVFHGWLSRSGGMYERFRLIAYGASAIEMTTLACWLVVVRRFPVWSRPAGGVMLAGALFSAAVGLSILPFSLLGLLFAGVGALGFIPFATAVVYLRNGRRALRLNRATRPVPGASLVSFAFGVALALGVPAAARVAVEREVESAFAEALTGGRLSPMKARALRALTLAAGPCLDGVANEYWSETDYARKAQLAKVYREVTGHEIGSSALFDD
jgi:hypothetical protein